ncbi:hypothetical protein SOVF_184340, partial [Spinacia oleracea]
MTKDYYKILEVEDDATDEDIRLSYQKLALKWHPDKRKDDSVVVDLQPNFKILMKLIE